MKISWLSTTAVALLLGTGAVVAQSPSEQKREESPRAQQSKDTEPQKGRAAQSEQKGSASEQKGNAKEQRGEAPTPAERSKQAQEPADTKQPTKQSQDQGRDSKQPESRQSQQERTKQDNQARDAKQSEQKKDSEARDTKQPEPKQQQGQAPSKQDNQARDTKQPETKQQQGQQQPAPGTQPSNQTTQQGTRPGDTKQGQTTTSQSTSTSTSTSAIANVDQRQRTEIVDTLRRDRAAVSQNIDVQVNVGVSLPSRARIRPLPADIVRIVPQYRGYDFTIVEDEIVIVEPRTRRVVEVIDRSGSPRSVSTSRFSSGSVQISTEQRETLRQVARRSMTTAQSSLSDQSCLTLQPVPEELTRSNAQLSAYRMLTIGEQVVLVDPRDKKVIEVIE